MRWSALLSSGDEQEVLLRLQAAGGGEVEVAVTLSSFGEKGASGDGASGVLGVGVDITKLSHSHVGGAAGGARAEAADRLRERCAALSLSLSRNSAQFSDATLASLYSADLRNATALITEWNKKATQLTGRSKWEVVGRRLEEFIQARTARASSRCSRTR